MKRKVFLGIDIGTSQSKGVLADGQGRILARAAVDHETAQAGPGLYEHDAEGVWVRDAKSLIARLKEEAGVGTEEITAAALSAIGPCVLPVDAEGRPLRPAILYGIDTRATEEIQELNEAWGEEEILRRCGNALSTQAAGPKIAWIRRHEPEIFEKTAVFMTSTTYLVHRLTGRAVIDHYTACAGYTPLYNFEKQTWDTEMCRALGCEGRLPELSWTAEAAGTVTAEAAAEFGLPAGIPVAAGTCDAAAEAVSVGVMDPGDTMLMLGSTAFMICVTQADAIEPRLWCAPWLFPGTHCLLGGMGSAGSLTKWFLREVSRETAAEAERTGENPYAVLARKAENIPAGSGGLTVLPYFAGERTPLNDPQAKGVIFGLTHGHTQEHLYRAFLESVAYGIRDNLSVMEEAGAAPQTLTAAGGGTLNTAWMRMICDVNEKAVRICEVTMGAAYGDAFLAALCAGEAEGPKTVRLWNPEKTRLLPEETDRAVYEKGFAAYRALYRALADRMHES